jgi:hypothetical protein
MSQNEYFTRIVSQLNEFEVNTKVELMRCNSPFSTEQTHLLIELINASYNRIKGYIEKDAMCDETYEIDLTQYRSKRPKTEPIASPVLETQLHRVIPNQIQSTAPFFGLQTENFSFADHLPGKKTFSSDDEDSHDEYNEDLSDSPKKRKQSFSLPSRTTYKRKRNLGERHSIKAFVKHGMIENGDEIIISNQQASERFLVSGKVLVRKEQEDIKYNEFEHIPIFASLTTQDKWKNVYIPKYGNQCVQYILAKWRRYDLDFKKNSDEKNQTEKETVQSK